MAEVSISEELLKKVGDQVKFYFGDVNILRDRFMKEEMMKNDGWLPFDVLMTFNRLKNLVKDYDNDTARKIVIDASKKVEILEVDADEKLLRREPKSGIPKTRCESNTLVVKGFKMQDVTLDQLLEFFNKYEGVEAVVMRSYREKVVGVAREEKSEPDPKPELQFKKQFKGSVFAVFKEKDQAKACMDALQGFKDDPKLINEGSALTVMWQLDHKVSKQVEMKERLDKKRKAEAPVEVEEKPELLRGTVLLIKGVPADITRETIKETWIKVLKDFEGEEDLKIAFVDYRLGQLEGKVRLASASAKKAIEFMQGKLVFGSSPAAELCEIAEGDEETYLKEVEKQIQLTHGKAKKHRTFNNKRRGGRGGRGGRGRR